MRHNAFGHLVRGGTRLSAAAALTAAYTVCLGSFRAPAKSGAVAPRLSKIRKNAQQGSSYIGGAHQKGRSGTAGNVRSTHAGDRLTHGPQTR